MLGICSACNAQDEVKVLSPEDFISAVKNDSTATVLDVRKPSEFAEGHLPEALNLDWLDTVSFNKGLKELDKKHNYYIYCRSGRRSNEAARKMQKDGYKVFDMAGGYLAYRKMKENK